MWVLYRLALALLIAISTGGASVFGQLPPFERILLPVVAEAPVPGDRGSVWQTVISIRNESGETATVFPPDCPPHIPGQFCFWAYHLEPGVTKHPHYRLAGITPLVLNVEKAYAPRIAVQLRVHDLSRQGESHGTDIPVVREKDMRVGWLQILDIPYGEPFRASVRVYADRVTEESKISIQLTDEVTLSAWSHEATVKPLVSPSGDPSLYPGFYFEVVGIPSLPGMPPSGTARLTVSGTNDAPVFALVTVTNNQTQQVTTLVPR